MKDSLGVQVGSPLTPTLNKEGSDAESSNLSGKTSPTSVVPIS